GRAVFSRSALALVGGAARRTSEYSKTTLQITDITKKAGKNDRGTEQNCRRNRRRHRRWTRGLAGVDEGRLHGGARRAAHGKTAGDAEARRSCRQEPSRLRRHDRSRIDRRPVRQGDGRLWPV